MKQSGHKDMISIHRVVTLLALSIFVISAQALPVGSSKAPPPADAVTAVRGLSSDQITAIRKVGRSVLTAKKSGQEDGEDAAQLANLRASVDSLIAADLAFERRTSKSVQGKEHGDQPNNRKEPDRMLGSAQAEARALVWQLHQRSEIMTAQSLSMSNTRTLSAGFPVGEQRARLFRRLASKLDAALSEDGVDRANRLRELRKQLQDPIGGISKAPLAHGTPTLQSMPPGYESPKNKALQTADTNAGKE